MLISTLAIFRGYSLKLSTTIIDYFGLRQSSKTLTITRSKRALSPTWKHYNVNEHPRNPSGNTRYRQLVNTIMLTSTLAILRNTFGKFRRLSLTTSACVSLHRDLYYYLERTLSPACDHYFTTLACVNL